MKVKSPMIHTTDREYIYFLMEFFMMDNGRMACNMAMELIMIKMEIITRVNLLMVREMERANLHN